MSARRPSTGKRSAFVTHTHLDPTSQVAYDLWKMTKVGWFIDAPEGTPGNIHAPMPPIRCTVSPPCGWCWYCRTADGR